MKVEEAEFCAERSGAVAELGRPSKDGIPDQILSHENKNFKQILTNRASKKHLFQGLCPQRQ